MKRTARSHPLLPYLALGLGVICLGFSALFTRWAAAPGPVMAFYRIGLATLILLPLFARQVRRGDQACAEESDAAGTALYDVAHNQWAWDVIDALDLHSP